MKRVDVYLDDGVKLVLQCEEITIDGLRYGGEE